MTADLNTLLDSLTDGEHVKATWTNGEHRTTIEGPVYVSGWYCECRHATIRWSDGGINDTLVSIEVTRTGDVTVTRDDEKAPHALLDTLEDGEEVTAEWRNRDGSMTLTGTVKTSSYSKDVWSYRREALRGRCDKLCRTLLSVTVRRPVMQRWEREGNE